MTTDSWVGGTGTSQQFGTEGASDANWSTGKVPDSSDEAVISTSSATTVTASSSEDVNSIALGSNDTLDIGPGFTVQDGTGPNVNDGTVDIGGGDNLYLSGGAFDSNGSIAMAGGPLNAKIQIEANTTLDGSGIIAMQGVDNEITGDVLGENPNLISSERTFRAAASSSNLTSSTTVRSKPATASC